MSSRPAAMSAPTLTVGSRLPDGSVIEQALSTDGAVLHLAGRHPELGAVQARVMGPAAQRAWAVLESGIAPLAGVEHPGLELHLGRGTVQGMPYLLTQAVTGLRLNDWLQARLASQEGELSPAEALNLASHVARALETLHAYTPHGALLASDVIIANDGRVVLTGAGYQRIALCSEGVDAPAWIHASGLAPEVREDPWNAVEASDYWSLGVLLLTLLQGETPDVDGMPLALDRLPEGLPTELVALLEGLLDEEPALRMCSPEEVQAHVEAALRRMSEQAGPAPIEDPFAGLELPPAPPATGPDEIPLWIIRREGRDWGPYSERAIIEQLHRDEIDENTTVVDTRTRESGPLGRTKTFAAAVKAYLPVRAAKEQERVERRENTVKAVKRTSTTSIVLASLTGVLLAYIGYENASSIERAQLDVTQSSWGYVVPAPNLEFTGISADEALLAELFDFRDPAAADPTAPSRRRPTAAAGGPGAELEEEEILEDDYVLDFNDDSPTSLLTSDQINATVRENLFRIRDCYDQERAANPGFTGVVAAWSIRPDGRVMNARITETGGGSSQLQSCVVRSVRRMVFPTFNNTPMNISFPLRMQ